MPRETWRWMYKKAAASGADNEDPLDMSSNLLVHFAQKGTGKNSKSVKDKKMLRENVTKMLRRH